MITLKIFQKQRFYIITMTPWGTLKLCCVRIAQLITFSAIYALPSTLRLCYKSFTILQRVNNSQKVHISSHDELQKFYKIDFAWHRSQGLLREEFPSSRVLVFSLRTIMNPFPGIWEPKYHIKWGARRKLGFSFLLK